MNRDDIVAELVRLGWAKLAKVESYPPKKNTPHDPYAIYITSDGFTYAVLIYTMGGQHDEKGASQTH
jgi:hypothetical protein